MGKRAKSAAERFVEEAAKQAGHVLCEVCSRAGKWRVYHALGECPKRRERDDTTEEGNER